ncbi:MAG: SUMF1/EgtB/PvdO family nonheme iron enzyme [Rhodospirillales bacterium]|nr:SUMF1/EgtB/PvdO family nonheme iron enzyme [Rhodospirillales bacterium]
MPNRNTHLLDHCRRLIATHGNRPLVVTRGGALTVGQGYVPQLVNYTFEDEAARGLRSLRETKTKITRAEHFTALERLAREPRMLLLGERGGGKTAFALHVALNLAGEIVGSSDYNRARLCKSVPRGASAAITETWTDETLIPLYIPLADVTEVAAEVVDVRRHCDDTLLLILDGSDRLGDSGADFLQDMADLVSKDGRLRVLVTGETMTCDAWPLPSGFTKRRLLPFSEAQRRELRPEQNSPSATGHPGLFFCETWLDDQAAPGSRHAIADQWLATVVAENELEKFVAEGFHRFTECGKTRSPLDDPGLNAIFGQAFFLEYMAARHLESKPLAEAVGLFNRNPDKWSGTIRILAARLERFDALIEALVRNDQRLNRTGALMSARIIGESCEETALKQSVAHALLDIVTEGALPPARRAEAGRYLAAWGDPRQLDALVQVPGGDFTMGSTLNPNSSPPHRVRVEAFRIGKYPVTNRWYLKFIEDSDRAWLSENGRRPERANAPAVDLTWHDAQAFCDWQTIHWRREERIGQHDVVRLPTEPEWERAARGEQPDADTIVYPWCEAWDSDRQNSEETAFNDTCAVGLFPRGVSPYGCHDMCGLVWEWTSTLWGSDMTAPSFRYPYTDDGRESADAGPEIRRVLRGGSFSSGREKTCCTYRGSLEPNGFWRGNGFRIVVVRQG